MSESERPVPASSAGATAVPVLCTERLILRGHRLSDFEDCAALWGDPAVTRHIGGKPLTREEAWTKFLRASGHWSMMGYGFWVVHEAASGRFVGEVGCAEFKRDLDVPVEGFPEAGWVLASWAQGRGLATEAVQAALAWTLPRVPCARAICLIDPENAPSIRVASKCGFRPWGRSQYKQSPVLLFERPA